MISSVYRNLVQVMRQKQSLNFFSFAQPAKNTTYTSLNDSDISKFREFMSENEILTSVDDVKSFNTDWMNVFEGSSRLVLKPQTTEQISQILQHCNTRKLPVSVQGGNTGLVGGSVPIFDQIILNLSNLQRVLKFDENTQTITCQAGCVLQSLNNYLKQYNCEIPLDLGAKGSCFIGGNISTHAGGKYLIKYGPLRANILGIEVVLPDGRILDLQSQVRKDNTGYDLKQLFIGAEGTLGIVTKANILCREIEAERKLILIKCNSFAKVLGLMRTAKNSLGQDLAAFQYMDSQAFGAVVTHLPSNANPFQEVNKEGTDFYCVVEIASNIGVDSLLESFFEKISSESLYTDIIASENQTQYNNLWKIREECALAANQVGQVLSYDLSINPENWFQFTENIRNLTKDQGYTLSYGHIGDGNIHINVCARQDKYKESLEKLVEPLIFQMVSKLKGSISAEHGIGFAKAGYLNIQRDPITIEYMRNIKKIFDPNLILNPYQTVI